MAKPIDVESWRVSTAGPFRMLTNADADRATELLVDLERFRRAFGDLAPGLDASFPVPTTIVAFRDADAYASFKTVPDREGSRIVGQFLSHRDGNFITLNADSRLTGGLGVVLHEYVHYLLNQNLPRIPRWLNEGLAEYYSTFSVEGDYAVVGRPVPRHLRWWRHHESVDVANILSAGSESDHFAEQAGEFYAVSWGLTHYLLSSPNGASVLASYVEGVASGADPVAAFQEASEWSMRELEEALRRHLVAETVEASSLPLARLGAVEVSETPSSPDHSLTLLGDLAARLGQERQAEEFYDLALAYQGQNAEASSGLAVLRDLQGRVDEAKYLHTDALAAGPRSARTYLRHGRHLLRRIEVVQSEEQKGVLAQRAKSSFEAAVALDPSFAENYVMLAVVHLFPGLDASVGISYAEKAVALLPTRGDLYQTLIRLYLKGGAIAPARRVLEGSFRYLSTEEEWSRLSGEIRRAELLLESRTAIEDGRWQEGIELFDRAISHTQDGRLRLRMEAQLERLEAQAIRASSAGSPGR